MFLTLHKFCTVQFRTILKLFPVVICIYDPLMQASTGDACAPASWYADGTGSWRVKRVTCSQGKVDYNKNKAITVTFIRFTDAHLFLYIYIAEKASFQVNCIQTW